MHTIVHIPHSSTLIPVEFEEQFLLGPRQLDDEVLRLTDWFTDEIFGGMSGCRDVVFPVSRLVLDPERFENDDEELMSKLGLGVIYTATSGLEKLRRELSASEREVLLERFYRPHHRQLNLQTRALLEQHGECLLLDAHSFPRKLLPYELNPGGCRPEICIGTDEYHTPDGLVDVAVREFEQAGFTVSLNQPFSGALVPSDFYRRDKRVHALMIELRRDLYMDELTGQKLPEFNEKRQRVRTTVSLITQLPMHSNFPTI
jgi:N-formylglutamate deformylase